MFRPPSLLAPRIVPTAANTAAGQLGLLRPGLSCVVAAARPGYANRPNTGNWRYGDLHPARLSALSAAPLPDMPSSMTTGSSYVDKFQSSDVDIGLRRDLSGSALPLIPQSVSRGASISRLPGSHICYGLSVCSPPCTDLTGFPAIEG